MDQWRKEVAGILSLQAALPSGTQSQVRRSETDCSVLEHPWDQSKPPAHGATSTEKFSGSLETVKGDQMFCPVPLSLFRFRRRTGADTETSIPVHMLH